MKRVSKRLVSMILVIVMCMHVLPLTAMASLIDNDPEYNKEILDALTEIVGSEDEAERYYELLDYYGLLDEDGNLSESWEIYMDGRQVTLDEVVSVLEDPNCDLDKYIIVDGTAVTLGNVKTILEIEEYIAYLRKTYYDGHQWTAEQLDSLQSLLNQIENEGIRITSAGILADGTVVGASGVNHGSEVAVSLKETAGTTATFTAVLSGAAANQTVSFDWEAISGSQPVSGSGTVEMIADENGEASADFEVTLKSADAVYSTAELVYIVKLDNLTNALFENGLRTFAVTGTGAATVSEADMEAIGAIAQSGSSRTFRAENADVGSMNETFVLSDMEKLAVIWGVISQAELRNYAHDDCEELDSDGYFMNYIINEDESNFFPDKKWYAPAFADDVTYSLTMPNGTSLSFQKTHEIKNYTLKYKFCNTYVDNVPQIVDKTADAVNIRPIYQLQYLTGSITPQDDVSWTFTFTGSANYREWFCGEYKDFVSEEHLWHFGATIQNQGNRIGNNVTMACDVVFVDSKIPEAVAAAPAAEFYPGQTVPVIVTFSEPVDAATAKVKFNGEDIEYTAVESSGYSNVLTFLYPVKALDNVNLSVSSITATDLSGKTLDNYNPGGNAINGEVLNDAILSTPSKEDAITGIGAEVESNGGEVALNVSLKISDNERITQWLTSGGIETGTQPIRTKVEALSASIDGGVTKYPFVLPGQTITGETVTASIPLDLVIDNAVTHVVELYLENKLLVGKYTIAEQQPAVLITEADLSASISIGDYSFENPEQPVFYIQGEDLGLKASINIGTGFTFGNTAKTAVAGTAEAETADFVWESTNTNVANIDKNGNITPNGMSGETQIRLTARNGGIDGRAVTVIATYTVNSTGRDTLTFTAGLTPFLTIPSDGIETVDGQDAIVYWSSNLCDKNGDVPTVFTVTVTRGSETVYETTVSGTAQSPVASAVIPGDRLHYDYNSGNNTLTVTVSASYGGVEYKDTAVLGMEALPAEVKLEKLDNYYILDTQNTLNIAWSVKHLDHAGGVPQDQIFRFRITRNDTEISTNVVLALDNGADSGIFALPIENIIASADDPASYRDIYTVTIEAKNGADSTWSYDSFLLYVYDEDALKIMVDGVDRGDGITMSNREAIAAMSRDEILALKRDIYLKNIISVNYGEYAWTEVADQIIWASDDSSVASINYQQGTLYENIESFTYTSYRPTTELGLSGLKDGETIVSAIHKLTGMEDTLNVTVETLKDKLYLFQCYPQAETTLTYINGNGETKTAYSDETGAAAVYEESGIASDVYCSADVEGITYLGTFYRSTLKTGEGDWTKLERYPCNNLNLRRAAYAYVYLKAPNDKPYAGEITFRGGVYVNGEYKEDALFGLNSTVVDKHGNTDNTVTLGSDGKLTVIMDQTQWDLPGGAISAGDKVEYVFQIEQSSSLYYPILYTIDATANEDAFISNGNAVLPFRTNAYTGEHPFIAALTGKYSNYGASLNLIGNTGNVGPSDSLPETAITTIVMWWGEDMMGLSPSLQFVMEDNTVIAAADEAYTIENSIYPFSDIFMTQYTVRLDESSISSLLEPGETAVFWLNYYKDGETLYLHEEMTFKLCNMIGVGKVEESEDILSMLQTMGDFAGTSAKDSKKDFGDQFVNIALNLVSSDSYSTGDSKLFSIQLAPTSDPTKFLGFIEVNVGNVAEKDQVTGIYANENTTGESDLDYSPGVSELLVLAQQKTPSSYIADIESDFADAKAGKGGREMNFSFGGYAESLIYYDVKSSSWNIQILSGGFTAGGGMSYTWNWNTMVGPVPFTASLTIGGTAEIGMDALTVAYTDSNNVSKLGNDFLTELRIYLYLRFFAGVGIDYSVIAFKLGIFGQIDLDMQFQWLNRPYLEDGGRNTADGRTDPVMHGQHFKIDGTIGLEFVVRFLFFSYEKVLWSMTFNLLNEGINDWDAIQDSWTKNQAALQSAISGLLNDGGMSVYRMNGRQMYSLNLAPTMEDRSYLESNDFYRQWGDSGISTFALDASNALANLQSSAYPYANPVVSDDGQLVGYLSDMDSTDVTMTRAAYGVMNGGNYDNYGVIDNGGYGDSQLAISGTKDFAVAAWTRQTVNINKDAGSVVTDADQIMMVEGTEVYAAVYTNNGWTTTALSNNSSPDLAPVVASNGSRAVVAWRSVSTSGKDGNITSFDQKDNIVYKIYDGNEWSELKTLYNGTSGAVKGITAAMMEQGTVAVAYTLDADKNDGTLNDKEIYYAVIDNDRGEVARNIRATNDGYLDENPQLTAVTFPSDNNNEHFVLGWYTEQAVAKDSAAVLNAGETGTGNTTTSDIRLIDFTAEGLPGQLLPDSISQVADSSEVMITSNFRFVKNADSVNDLSILWAERAAATLEALEGTGNGVSDTTDLSGLKTEKDVLKGVKFYTYGQHGELIRFTGAIDVAEMYDGTLIDHFDAYVSDADANEIKAVILGTTYGAGGTDGTVTKIVTLDNAERTQAQVTVPTQTTSMYTATETYTDKITVPAILADYETVRKGAKTQIQFTVENDGIHAINNLTLKVGEDVTVYDGLNLLPGNRIQLYADYTVPEDGVVDPEYVITADFGNDGATGSAQTMRLQGLRRIALNEVSGTVYLDLPDIEITKAEIVDEVDGKRTIRVLLNNGSDADLVGSGCKVKIGFYTDAAHAVPVEGLDAVIVTNDSDFAMIDEGGYSTQVVFDVKSYIEEADLAEIPESGITVYIMAQVLDENGEVQGEPVSSDNFDSVVCENLKVRTGKDAIVTSTLTNDGNGSTVTVNLQNTRLSETYTGNIIVTLLDAEGNVLGQQQSYNGTDGLITLTGEQKRTETFTFVGDEYKDAVEVEVVYSDLIIGADNANLVSLSFSNFPGISLNSFTEDQDNPGVYRASVETDSLTSTAVIAVAESGLAKIKLSDTDTGSNIISQTVALRQINVQDITITVTNGTDTKKYILTVWANTQLVVTAPTFDAVTYGDYDSEAKEITITNQGIVDAGITGIELIGTNADSFILTRTDPLSVTGNTVALKSGLDAGTYTAVITVAYDNNKTATAEVSITVNKKSVDVPDISSKTYTGNLLTANIPASTLYTVNKNDGGTNVGEYDVELILNDPANYKWANSDDAAITLKFEITKSDSQIETAVIDAVYGDIIKLEAAVGIKNVALFTMTPAQDQVAFYCGEVELGVADVVNGVAELMYDTSDRKLNIGSNVITVYYGGSVNLNGTNSDSITVNLSAKDVDVEITPNGGVYGETITAALATYDATDLVVNDTLDVILTYTGTANNGTVVDSTTVPAFAGNYTVTASTADGYYNLVGTLSKAFTVSVKKIAKPVQDTTVYTYNGREQTYGVAENDYYTVQNGVQTNANEDGHNVIIILKDKDNTVWEDESVADITHKFIIEQVEPAVNTVPTATRMEKGRKLEISAIVGGEMTGINGTTLEGTFAWKAPQTVMDVNGNIEAVAVFTPNDTVNYKTAEITITVEVYKPSNAVYYAVKFESNGAAAITQQLVVKDSFAMKPADPVKDGYIFGGWYTDKECTTAYDFGTKVTNDITLYAKWTKVTSDPCDGTSADNCRSLAYRDIDTTQWYHHDIDYVLNNNMMNGMGGDIFAPNGNLSRAMLVTILWRLEGEPVQGTRADFSDVTAGQWYTEAVHWAFANEIVFGYDDGTFRPNDDITREQLAAIMYRYEQYKGGGFTGAWMIRMDYVDIADVSDWAYEAMCWCTMNGIINGRPGKVLDPKGMATRAEAAAILHRYCEKTEE